MTKLPADLPPPGSPLTVEQTAAVLAEFLGHCRRMVNGCVGEAWDKQVGMDVRITYTNSAARLMNTGLGLAARLEGDTGQTTHRVIVERGDTPPSNFENKSW